MRKLPVNLCQMGVGVFIGYIGFIHLFQLAIRAITVVSLW